VKVIRSINDDAPYILRSFIMNQMDGNALLNILLLSLVAGLGTSVGGLIAITRDPGKRSFGFLMGITAGVMISLAFLELVNRAWELEGPWTATIGFGAGAIVMFLIDFFIPHMRFGEKEEHSIESQEIEARADGIINGITYYRKRQHKRGRPKANRIIDQKLMETGILLAIGISIHNLPEGIAIGAGYLHTPKFGFFVALAIMLHNIPEGIATALPLHKCGMSKWDAFKAAMFSGLAEPIGALFAALFLTSFSSLIPGALAFAGGVMVFITLDELVPMAREHGQQQFSAIGIILGSMFVFILSGLFGA
jgi:ZIP family zinc transporter